ncbi:MAG: FecR domain-containing protein [Myxococcota bacterium]
MAEGRKSMDDDMTPRSSTSGATWSPLRALGRAMAEAQNAEAGPAVDAVRGRLFDLPKPRKTFRWGGPTRFALAAALLLVPLILLLGSRGMGGTAGSGAGSTAWSRLAVAWGLASPPPALTFSVAGTPGAAGLWVDVVPHGGSSMLFSDGTQMWLSGGTRARVGTLAAEGAEVHLERGELHVAVAHREAISSWRFEAGPYDVFVTGTEFVVGWDPAAQRFRLEMVAGSVEVAGPRLQGRRVMVAGQTLVLRATAPPSSTPVPDVEASRASASPARSALPVPSVPAAAAVATPPSGPPAPAVQPDVTADPKKPDVSVDWRALAREGRYVEAYAEAAPDFDALVASASASDLLMLADVARFAGAGLRARGVWEAVRRRYPGSSASAQAAFALGRAGDGARWFSIYLQEAPDGALAREALGRLLEAQRGTEGADDTARRYLARHPDGPHARLARRVLSRELRTAPSAP